MRDLVDSVLPAKCTVLLAGKRHDDLLAYGDRTVVPYPAHGEGGQDPTSSLAAITHLIALRAEGADYLVIAGSSLRWLEVFEPWARHLDQQYKLLLDRGSEGRIYALAEPPATAEGPVYAELQKLVDDIRLETSHEPSVLDWHTGLSLAKHFPDLVIFSPLVPGTVLPYLDCSVDVVVFTGDEARHAEAQRVSRVATVNAVVPDDDRMSTKHSLEIWTRDGGRQSPMRNVSIILGSHDRQGVADSLLMLCETIMRGFTGEVIVVSDVDVSDSVVCNVLSSTLKWIDIGRARDQGAVWHRGAEGASGELYVFLAPQVVLLPNWLPAILQSFQSHPEAGIVAGKVVSRDGVLREAGISRIDGTPMQLGSGKEAESPSHTHVREIDGCSELLIATRRSDFEAVCGFRHSDEYASTLAYCDRVKAIGRAILYQPEVVSVTLRDSPELPREPELIAHQA